MEGYRLPPSEVPLPHTVGEFLTESVYPESSCMIDTGDGEVMAVVFVGPSWEGWDLKYERKVTCTAVWGMLENIVKPMPMLKIEFWKSREEARRAHSIEGPTVKNELPRLILKFDLDNTEHACFISSASKGIRTGLARTERPGTRIIQLPNIEVKSIMPLVNHYLFSKN